MTSTEAKEILRRCRPGTADTTEPEVTDALALAQRDPELAAWWASEQAWQHKARASLRGVEPPTEFRQSLNNRIKVAQRFSWRRPIVVLGVAAALAVMFLGWRWQQTNHAEDSSAVWRQRMARVALREYRMDVQTNSLAAVETFLTQSGAPTQVSLPTPVSALPVLGGASLQFQNRPVSMICFDRGGGQLLWMFAIDQGVLRDVPAGPRFEQIGTLATLIWTSGDRLLLLAVQGDERLLRRYL